MKKILFVCTGNICRSSSAEAVFKHLVEKEGRADGFYIDSAGTHDYHVGEPSDSRAVAVAKKHGISMQGITARKISSVDFQEFDLILAMDKGHLDLLAAIMPKEAKAELALFMDFSDHQKGEDVPDPYYGDADGFDVVINMLKEGAAGLLKTIE